jgi:hypothetical protein
VDEILTRPLARYVSELIRIRKKYEDLLFYGRFNDTTGATLQGDPDIRYSVFQSSQANDSSQACVVVNFGDTPESAELNFEGASSGAPSTQIVTPTCPSTYPFLLISWP